LWLTAYAITPYTNRRERQRPDRKQPDQERVELRGASVIDRSASATVRPSGCAGSI
jgi:hypothetical protein